MLVRRSWTLISILIVLTLAIGASTVVAQDDLEPVTITYWTDPALARPTTLPEFDGIAQFEQWQAEQFMEMYPHVTVEVRGLDWPDLPQVVPAAIAAGDPPDILKDYLGRTSGYGIEEVTVDLFELLPQEEIDDLLPGLVDLYTINGRLHAMPTYFWNHAMIVNKGLFDEAGLGDLIPTDDYDWTFDEFYDAITQLKAANPDVEFPFALQVASEQGDYDFHGFIWGAGGEIWQPDCSAPAFDDPGTLAGVSFVNQLYQEGLINPDATTASYDEMVNYVYTGKSAVVGGGLGVFNVRLPQAQADGLVTVEAWDPVVMMYPHAEGETNGLAVGPTGFAVFDKGRSEYEMEWIKEFLLFLNSSESQITYTQNNSQFPARVSAGIPLEDDPNYVLSIELVQERGTESMGLSCEGFYDVRIAQPPAWQAMFLGQSTPEETLQMLTDEADFLLGG